MDMYGFRVVRTFASAAYRRRGLGGRVNIEVREQVCGLLTEVLQLLDTEDAAVAAIHVSHALETLGCPITDPGLQAAPTE